MTSPSLKKIDIVKFLELARRVPVVDVRSPSEFNAGHIPGAINIPLFDDREREEVGIKYNKEGRSNAILKGLELAGKTMHIKLSEAIHNARSGMLLLYCWRGGMRSETMAWFFSLGDISTEVLEGGYKSYRQHVLAGLSEERKTIVLGGMTGSSKTHILKHIRELGHQVIDLEGLANHKGSAFGALGQLPQPSSEHFANILYTEWERVNNDQPVWIEDESRNIGTVFMPDNFYNNLQNAPSVILLMKPENRMPRLIEEYSTYTPDKLKESVMKVSKRLGGDNTKEVLNAIDAGNYVKAIEIILKYYDKTYMYSISRKPIKNIIFVETDTDNIEINSFKILEVSNNITW